MTFAPKKLSAYEALCEAQKISYAPVIFHAVRSLRNLGILDLLGQSGIAGMSEKAISETLGISAYGVGVLLECGLSCNVVEYTSEATESNHAGSYHLGKVGYYILNDPMTRVNMDFNNDVCYQGLADLEQSVIDGKPRGLKVFGSHWNTIYEALPDLPDAARDSWYAFDHYYSDLSYPLVLPIVLKNRPKTLSDIGSNIGKFTILLAQADPGVEITMIDLPGTLNVARQHVESAGVSDRVRALPMNMLDAELRFPIGQDVYWMSQLLSCFAKEGVVNILANVRDAMASESRLLIMETCWDRQKHEAAAFSLVNTSPYFTCMASGNSKMYRTDELLACFEQAGLDLVEIHDDLGVCHSLFECRRL